MLLKRVPSAVTLFKHECHAFMVVFYGAYYKQYSSYKCVLHITEMKPNVHINVSICIF